MQSLYRGEASDSMTLQAGLLASGSSLGLRLPIISDSGIMQRQSPVTATGPRRIYTVFPFKPLWVPVSSFSISIRLVLQDYSQGRLVCQYKI
jgi:hypothetical protein